MKTLNVTAARAKLGYWLRGAANGENIGIVCLAFFVAWHLLRLRPGAIGALRAELEPRPEARA